MEKKERVQENKHRVNARLVLVLSCALFLCVMITFGLTMAYFGGKSSGYTADFILKAGIQFGKNDAGTDTPTMSFDSNILVPGTSLNSVCKVHIESGTENVENTAVNGVLRLNLVFSGTMSKFISLKTDPIYVYKGTESVDMIEGNKIARLTVADDGYFYLVGTETTQVSTNTALYEIDCVSNGGEYDLIFAFGYDVLNVSPVDSTTFLNTFAGKTGTVKASFVVLQSEVYDTTTTPLPITYKNLKPIFDESQALGS